MNLYTCRWVEGRTCPDERMVKHLEYLYLYLESKMERLREQELVAQMVERSEVVMVKVMVFLKVLKMVGSSKAAMVKMYQNLTESLKYWV